MNINYGSIKKFFGLDPDEIDVIQEVGDIFQFGTLWIALFFIALYPTNMTITPMVWLYVAAGQLLVSASLKKLVSKYFPKLSVRPNGGKDSMPSGHTCAAYAGFGCLFFGINEYNTILIIATVILLALAVFTGFSRIAAKKHHFRDVCAGAAIGLISSWIIINTN